MHDPLLRPPFSHGPGIRYTDEDGFEVYQDTRRYWTLLSHEKETEAWWQREQGRDHLWCLIKESKQDASPFS